jgi:hypothetical protein
VVLDIDDCRLLDVDDEARVTGRLHLGLAEMAKYLAELWRPH